MQKTVSKRFWLREAWIGHWYYLRLRPFDYRFWCSYWTSNVSGQRHESMICFRQLPVNRTKRANLWLDCGLLRSYQAPCRSIGYLYRQGQRQTKNFWMYSRHQQGNSGIRSPIQTHSEFYSLITNWMKLKTSWIRNSTTNQLNLSLRKVALNRQRTSSSEQNYWPIQKALTVWICF